MTKNNQINDNGYDMTDIYLSMIKYSWNAIFLLCLLTCNYRDFTNFQVIFEPFLSPLAAADVHLADLKGIGRYIFLIPYII
jgi:hypothetical protein